MSARYVREGFRERWQLNRRDGIPQGFSRVDLVVTSDSSAIAGPPVFVSWEFNATTVLHGPGWEFASLHPDETADALAVAFEALCDFVPGVDPFPGFSRITRLDPSTTRRVRDPQAATVLCDRWARFCRSNRHGRNVRREFESESLTAVHQYRKGHTATVYDLPAKYASQAKKLNAPNVPVPPSVRLEARLHPPKGLATSAFPPDPSGSGTSWRPTMNVSSHDLQLIGQATEQIAGALELATGVSIDAAFRTFSATGSSVQTAWRLAAIDAVLTAGGEAAILSLPGIDRRALKRYQSELAAQRKALAAIDQGALVDAIAGAAPLYVRDLKSGQALRAV